ncbi:MAG: hypothetical protein IT393_00290 [Nitrospirae bacterium]|nr:hypothetical protein [Nitrospirota bacterium]
MTIEKVFGSIQQIVKGMEDLYQGLLEHFYDNVGYRTLWEEMLQGEENQTDLLNRCISIMPTIPHTSSAIVGRDVNYDEILMIIQRYRQEIKDGLDINRALKIAFYLEVLEIQGIFNEIIKLPQEPYFDILTEMHLETRRNMGNLVSGIEAYSYDEEFLHKVRELKSCIVERRSGTDRRGGNAPAGSPDRRNSDRRHERLVKITCRL